MSAARVPDRNGPIAERMENVLATHGWKVSDWEREAGITKGHLAKIFRELKRSPESVSNVSLRVMAQAVSVTDQRVTLDWLVFGTEPARDGVRNWPGDDESQARSIAVLAANMAGVPGNAIQAVKRLPVPSPEEDTPEYWADHLAKIRWAAEHGLLRDFGDE